jgi:serine/threonine protein kinase
MSDSSDAAGCEQLGEYRILREVGRGGMGVVYEAEQESLGRRVALKVLPPHTLHDAQQILRFEREAKAAARLHHTNIVPVFGVGHHGGTHYYVMQFIQGQGLDGVLEAVRQARASPGAGSSRRASGWRRSARRGALPVRPPARSWRASTPRLSRPGRRSRPTCGCRPPSSVPTAGAS